MAQNTDNVTAVMDAQFQSSGYSGAAKQHVNHVRLGETVHRKLQPTTKQTSMKNGSDQAAKQPSCESSQNSSAGDAGSNDGGDGRNATGLGGTSGDGFQKPREQRLREQKRTKPTRKPLYGSGTTDTLKAGKHIRELFVFNLAGDTTEDDLTTYLSNHDIQLTDIECRSKDNAVNKSFRIQIDNTDNDKVMNAELWPVRVGIRPYYRKRGSNEHKTNTPE